MRLEVRDAIALPYSIAKEQSAYGVTLLIIFRIKRVFLFLLTLFTEILPGCHAVVIEMERFTIVSGTFLRRL